jgi:glycosyltransferase involved in cell wall biosynthesis
VLERLAEELPIRLYTSNERKGYQQAVIDAISHACKEWLFVVDSDYQFAAIDFWRLEPYRRSNDIILGIKRPRRDPFYRVWLSAGFNALLRACFDVPYRDMDTGFRLLRRTAVQKITPEVSHLAFFTAEFVVRAHYAAFRIQEVPVHHYARKAGSTSIFFVSRLFLICFQQFVAVLKMKREFLKKGWTRRASARIQQARRLPESDGCNENPSRS